MSKPTPVQTKGTEPSPVDRELSAIVGNSPAVEKLGVPAAFRVNGLAKGPKVVLFGSIHGDEPAGYHAIKELLAQFASGSLHLERGSLILAVGNELGLERRVRQVEQNLNRLFKAEPNDSPTCYEERRAEDLKSLLTGAAYMLDLHATSQATAAFLMCEAHVLDEARSMGFDRIVTGWAELSDETLGGDTESYFNNIGGKGFTFETGQRDDPEGASRGLDAARRLLQHTGLLSYEAPSGTEGGVYQLFDSIKVDEASFRYARPLASFDPLSEGEVIGSAGEELFKAPCECFVVMPSMTNYMLARRSS